MENYKTTEEIIMGRDSDSIIERMLNKPKSNIERMFDEDIVERMISKDLNTSYDREIGHQASLLANELCEAQKLIENMDRVTRMNEEALASIGKFHSIKLTLKK